MDFWVKIDFAAGASRITEEEALVDVIFRLIGEKVEKRLMTMAPPEARTNWTIFWDFMSRAYGQFDHFSEAQTKVVEFKPGRWATPKEISRELKLRIGEMQAAWKLLKTSGQPTSARSAKALTTWQIYEKIKENIFKNGNNIIRDRIKRDNPDSLREMMTLLEDLDKSHFRKGGGKLWGYRQSGERSASYGGERGNWDSNYRGRGRGKGSRGGRRGFSNGRKAVWKLQTEMVSDDEFRRRLSKRLCVVCSSPAHHGWDCPERTDKKLSDSALKYKKFKEKEKEKGKSEEGRTKGDSDCWAFKKEGKCRYGDRCRFKHATRSNPLRVNSQEIVEVHNAEA
ncbi:MAG: zinc finger CCCH domain-containing protein, partial [bacterium]|nr:zinc finger CCCH domain-containing protein [bacterium]